MQGPWLKDAAADPGVPVTYDAELAEYHVEHRDGGYSIIRHCPWCGGAAPASKRASLFAVVPVAEWRRLERLTAKLHTVEAAVAALGEPEHRDAAGGLTIRTPARGRHPARAETFPTMTFAKLSKVADVTLADYGPEGIGFSFSPKYVGKRKVGRPDRQKPRRAPPRRRP